MREERVLIRSGDWGGFGRRLVDIRERSEEEKRPPEKAAAAESTKAA